MISPRPFLPTVRLIVRSRLGKYRIEACLAEGSYSNVYRAYDTIECIRVALKIPHSHLANEIFLDAFRQEARPKNYGGHSLDKSPLVGQKFFVLSTQWPPKRSPPPLVGQEFAAVESAQKWPKSGPFREVKPPGRSLQSQKQL